MIGAERTRVDGSVPIFVSEKNYISSVGGDRPRPE
jgi:hypothetical protein